MTWRSLWTNPPPGVVKINGNLVMDVQQLLTRPDGCYLLRGPITKKRFWFFTLTLVNVFAIYIGPEGKCLFGSEISRGTGPGERWVVTENDQAKRALERRLGI